MIRLRTQEGRTGVKDKGKASRCKMKSVKKLCKTVDSDLVNLSKKQVPQNSFSV